MIQIEVIGLKEIIQRMRQYPEKLNAATREIMQASLLTLWENVPPYPPKPEDSRYRRTGTLGRTLGSGETGGKSGSLPGIYEIKQLGAGSFEGRFGTRLGYAPYVIGDLEQAYMHKPGYKGRQGWWTMKTIAQRAEEKIERLWNLLAEKLVAFLNKTA